ncbi:hypothetical protein ASE16_03475 [Leifsonia sp. Root227]|uniref:N-acetylmuramoyl-L-alanine amidase n=1 Tax=Leifsonia sp. Root227 TaxID=1736496 RepID=UPI0006F5447F|nr:N-acetylmuramoyl-L-alanine amidase [Leifsonia sp. Root227]KRC52121.1 hypothetical protein ASE16_03475 [Leifsonia sp. Root227]
MFSPLTNQVATSSQRSSRDGAAIDHIILHHCASTDADGVVSMMVSGARQVSANYVIANDGRIIGVVDEGDRAWTSGSSDDGGRGAAFDRRSITFECANLSTNGWTISDASYESIARMCADVSRRYGFPLVRNGAGSTVLGHRELYEFFSASYATACPGGMDVDRVVARANQILAAGGGAVNDEEAELLAAKDEIIAAIRREDRARLYYCATPPAGLPQFVAIFWDRDQDNVLYANDGESQARNWKDVYYQTADTVEQAKAAAVSPDQLQKLVNFALHKDSAFTNKLAK